MTSLKSESRRPLYHVPAERCGRGDPSARPVPRAGGQAGGCGQREQHPSSGPLCGPSETLPEDSIGHEKSTSVFSDGISQRQFSVVPPAGQRRACEVLLVSVLLAQPHGHHLGAPAVPVTRQGPHRHLVAELGIAPGGAGIFILPLQVRG